jgi:hypothetical protein
MMSVPLSGSGSAPTGHSAEFVGTFAGRKAYWATLVDEFKVGLTS